MVDLLVRCRLVTTDDRTVSVAHEAVIRAWPRLRSWLDEDSAGLLILRHLSCRGGGLAGRRPAGQRAVPRLAARRRPGLAGASTPALTPVEDAFLDAAADQARAEQEAVEAQARQRVVTNRRLRLTVAATALGLVLALVAGSVAVQRSREASRTARDALVDSLTAESVALRATQRDLAALLAVEAHRLRPDARTRSALLGVFTATPGFLGYLTVGGADEPGPPLDSGQLMADGRQLLGVGSDGVIRDIDLDTGAVTGSFPAPSGEPSQAVVAMSRDETTLAEVSWASSRFGEQSLLGVYDVATRARRVPDVRLPFPAGAVAVSPDGRYVAVSGYDDGRVLVYDTAGRTRLAELLSVDMSARGVVALPPVGPSARLDAVRDFAEGRARQPTLSATRGSRTPASARPAAANTGEERFTAALSFQDDGSLVVGSEVGIVRVVDPGTGTSCTACRVHRGSPATAPWPCPRTGRSWSRRAVVAWSAGTWNGAASGGSPTSTATTAPPSWSNRAPPAPCAAAGSPASSRSTSPPGVRHRPVWTCSTGRSRRCCSPPAARWCSSAGRRTWSRAGASTGSGPSRTAWTAGEPDGLQRRRHRAAHQRSRGADGRGWPSWLELTAISAASGKVVWRGGDYVTAAWTSHPDRLIAWTTDGHGVLLDVRDGRIVRDLEGDLYGYPPDGTSVPPGGHHLLGWSDFYDHGESALAVWDLRTGAQVLLRTLPSGGDGSLTRDGRLVVMVQDEDSLAAYDVFGPDAAVDEPRGPPPRRRRRGRVTDRPGRSVPGGRSARLPPGPDAGAGGPTVAADARPGGAAGLQPGRRPAHRTEHHRRGADVRHRARTQLGEPIEIGLDRARSVALRPDGRALAVRTDDGMRVWDLRPERWSRAVCELVGRSLTREEWATYLKPVGSTGPLRLVEAERGGVTQPVGQRGRPAGREPPRPVPPGRAETAVEQPDDPREGIPHLGVGLAAEVDRRVGHQAGRSLARPGPPSVDRDAQHQQPAERLLQESHHRVVAALLGQLVVPAQNVSRVSTAASHCSRSTRPSMVTASHSAGQEMRRQPNRWPAPRVLPPYGRPSWPLRPTVLEVVMRVVTSLAAAAVVLATVIVPGAAAVAQVPQNTVMRPAERKPLVLATATAVASSPGRWTASGSATCCPRRRSGWPQPPTSTAAAWGSPARCGSSCSRRHRRRPPPASPSRPAWPRHCANTRGASTSTYTPPPSPTEPSGPAPSR